MLLDTYHKVAQMQDDRGDLPLHCLNWAVVSTSVVDKLLEAYPGAARAKNLEGQTPLHCACNKKINKNALISIQSLISVYPEGIDVEDNHGLLPSHYLTTNINYGQLPSHYFTNYPTRNSKKGHESNKFLLPQLCLKRDNHGKIPLHYACEGKTPNSIFYIMTLLSSSTESVYVEDWQTRTPRHILTNTASRKDENEMLPLHHLAAASDTLSVESLKLLVDVYPESITTADNRGLLPIHYACLNQSLSLDVLTQFIKLYPDGIMISQVTIDKN
jgi:ankyrin repeat protein